jgi:hypothetical protein
MTGQTAGVPCGEAVAFFIIVFGNNAPLCDLWKVAELLNIYSSKDLSHTSSKASVGCNADLKMVPGSACEYCLFICV